MNNLTTFYIVRHGESEGNAGLNLDRNIPRDLGSPLTDKGKIQVKELADILKNVHFDEIFTSPLSRTHETAEILAEERELAVHIKENLRERIRGNLNGQDEKELRKTVSHLFGNPEKLTDKEMWEWRLFDDMETAKEAVDRFILELREIAVAYPNKTIMIVTHGNLMRGLLVHLGAGTFKEYRQDTIKNSGYFVLESDGVDFFIKKTYGVEKHGSGQGTEEYI